MPLHDRFTIWLGLNTAELYRIYDYVWAGNFSFPRSLLKVEVFSMLSIPSKVYHPFACTLCFKPHHHSGFKLWCQRVLSITCWHERHTKTCCYITRLNWGGTDEIMQCCQSSTTNYHETQGDANWLIKDFNWRGSEESFLLSVMKDWMCWHMIWSRKGCTLFNKRAGKKKFTLE